MRDRDDIQRAHDVFYAIAAGQVDNPFGPDTMRLVQSVRDCLSWVLCGPCGGPFQDNLDGALTELEQRGFVLRLIN